MKSYRGSDGSRRLWFDPDEFEWIVEDEFFKANFTLSLNAPSVNLERFIEQHLNCHLDQYADLSPDLLGLTEFRPDAPPRIHVNGDLTAAFESEDSLSTRGRWRATLAHEAAHVLLHRSLYEIDATQTSLDFELHNANGPIVCLKREARFGSLTRDWREIQANMCMAALLMPRKIFRVAMDDERRRLGVDASATKGGFALVAALAARFDVSHQAARIRVVGLSPSSSQSAMQI